MSTEIDSNPEIEVQAQPEDSNGWIQVFPGVWTPGPRAAAEGEAYYRQHREEIRRKLKALSEID